MRTEIRRTAVVRTVFFSLAVLSAAPANAQLIHIVEIGAERYRETYREFVGGGTFIEEQADMTGLSGTLGIAFAQRHAVKLLGRYAQGDSDYIGASQNQPFGTLVRNGQDRDVAELRAVYAYSIPFSGNTVTPSLGIGYRALTDHLEQSGAGGYKRHSEYDFVALGLAAKWRFGQRWRIDPAIGYNILIRGTQHSYTAVDIVNRQHSGHGVELALPLVRVLKSGGELHIAPFYRYWHIGDSERFQTGPATFAYEPENTTREYGINLRYAF